MLPGLDEKTAANTISNYFVEKIKLISTDLEKSASNLIDHDVDNERSCTGSTLSEFTPVDELSLKKLIGKSKKTSCFLDPAPTVFLLRFLDIILPVLVKLINLSLEYGCVPDCFKKAVVKPLLKKSSLDPLVCKNYRPVSNLAYVSKLLERVVAEQLLHHLDINSYLDKYQSAYRPGFSTETALLKVINDSLISINSGKVVLLVLLDLSAAFDTINHQLLLQRLNSVTGICDTALAWFSSYLENRYQTVLVGTSFSDNSLLSCGVPQGSVLGPILFSIYTSELGKLIEKHEIGRQFFADDTQLINSFSPDPETVSRVIKNLELCCVNIKKWMTINRLKLNDDKTEVILLGTKDKRELVNLDSVKICESDIKIVDKVRNLGLIFDSGLSMVDHINFIVKSCYYHLRRLGRIRQCLTREAAATIALATIISRLDYCNCTLWGLPACQIERLQKIQNYAARIVTKSKPFDHITPVLRDLHWLPVKRRIDYKVLCIIYSCVNNCAPEYLRDSIPVYNPPRNLRSSSKLQLTLPSVDDTNKSKFGGRAFQNCAPLLWNNLPEHLKRAKNIPSFRKLLKTHLFSD